MAGEVQDNVWPLPKFYFSVQFGDGISASFQEVSGLDHEAQPIDYRHGDSPSFYPIKMPGLGKVGNVTMRKGIFVSADRLIAWYNEIKMNSVKRHNVVVRLLDQSGNPTMVWTLNNAFPTKITGPDLKATGNEIAIESVELAFDSLEVSAP